RPRRSRSFAKARRRNPAKPPARAAGTAAGPRPRGFRSWGRPVGRKDAAAAASAGPRARRRQPVGAQPHRPEEEPSVTPEVTPGLAARKAAAKLLAAVVDAKTPLDGLTDHDHGHPQ